MLIALAGLDDRERCAVAISPHPYLRFAPGKSTKAGKMSMTSRRLFGAAAGMIFGLLLLPPGAAVPAAYAAADSETYSQLNLLGDVFERLKSQHVEKPNDAKLIEGAINGMLEALDPHSRYMNEAAWREMQEKTRGEFGGLGIEVSTRDDLIEVISAIDDTPAVRAGLMSGDLISEVDGQSVRGLALEQAVQRMKGPLNTQVRLKIIRKSAEQPIDVAITREAIRVKSVRSKLDGDDIGYLRISTFGEQTTDELKKAVNDIARQVPPEKLAGYVIDLRNNPGGLLDQAVSVSSVFMRRGEVVSIRGRTPEDTQRFTARGGDLTKGKPLVVLINGGSASASEIVAGALHDHKRAVLIGTRSFGKGSVQTIMPLSAGKGALALTTARYFTPSGRSIQAQGIMPDIEVLQDVPNDLKGRADTKGEASMRGHLSAEGEEKTGSQSYVPTDAKDDKALRAAFNLLRGAVSAGAAKPPGSALPN
jgi:carboxyl-terminal processing protease